MGRFVVSIRFVTAAFAALFAGSISTGCAARAAIAATTTPTAAIRRDLLVQQALADAPGLESRLYLIEFPPGAESKLHMHSIQCVGYVLEGRFESAFGDQPATVKRAGESFVDLAHLPHRFRNPDAQHRLRFLIAGTFHKDEPLFQLLRE